jgi:hypothetical protein
MAISGYHPRKRVVFLAERSQTASLVSRRAAFFGKRAESAGEPPGAAFVGAWTESAGGGLRTR